MSTFECSGCHGQFASVNAGIRGENWCDNCFNFTTCARCNNVINRNMITYKSFEGKDYHPECFKCSQCKSKLKKTPSLYEGKMYCADCIRPCGTCYKPIGKTFLEFGDKVFHQNCLICSECKKSVGDEEFFETEDGALICADCLNA